MKPPLKFGIIGFGRFGKLWADCLKPYGKVLVYDQKKNALPSAHPANSPSKISSAQLSQVTNVDMLFLLVPMLQIESCCQKIAPLLPPNTVVIDACSVKIHPVNVMKRFLPKAQPLIATHPLFGPDSVKRLGLAGRKIVVHQLRGTHQQQQLFEKILQRMKLEIIHATPKQHDQQMANSQALVHFLGRGLAALKLKDQPISTPDYKSLVRINDMVNNDTWDLFFNMQRLNPFAQKMRQKLLKSLQYLEKKIGEINTLQGLRSRINFLDEEIITIIAERMAVATKIGRIKRKQHAQVTDKKREAVLQAFHHAISQKMKLNESLTDEIFQLIMAEAKRVQTHTQRGQSHSVKGT